MIMNMQNMNLNNSELCRSKMPYVQSCAAFASLSSVKNDPDSLGGLTERQDEEVAESRVSDWIVVCTHFCYDVVPCVYCMMGLDDTLHTFVGSSYNSMLLKQKQI